MVRGRGRAFLAGPPLLKAATGEIADDEALGGADMHARVSGLAEHVADDDASALGMARELIGSLGWQPRASLARRPEPLLPAEDLLALFGADMKKPVEMRQVIARIVDASAFLEFGADYGPATVCGYAGIAGSKRRHRHQQRPARPGRQHQGDALHPELRARRRCRSSGCRTPPASSSAPRPSAPA